MKLAGRAIRRNRSPDFFDWAEQRERIFRVPLPPRRIRDRFGLSPAVAFVTAELAGFAMEGR
jgi:hypothetical protein